MIRTPFTVLLACAAVLLVSSRSLRGEEDEGRRDSDVAHVRRELREIRARIDNLVDEGKEVPPALRDEAAALTDTLRQRGKRSGQRTRRGLGRPDDSLRDPPEGPAFHRPGGPPEGHPGKQLSRAVHVVGELLRLLDEQDKIRARIEEIGDAGEIPERLTQAAERVERRTRELRETIRSALARRGFGGRDGPGGRPPGAERRDRPRAPRRPEPRHGPQTPRPPGPPPGPEGPEAALGLLRDVAPEVAEEFRELRRENPEEFRHRMRKAIPEMQRLRRLREHDPEAFERTVGEKRAEFRARRLAREARGAKGETREKLAAELREHLNALFEVRMRSRDARMEQMEEELTKLRRDQERRRSQRDELIERRLLELLGESLEF